MLTLVTATPRTGKSLYVVAEILHPAVLAEELRPIYCDIKGFHCNVSKPVPEDWRDCEDGALIIMDEVQLRKRWNRTNKSEDQMILDLSTHGHRAIDIVIITQTPRYLNADVMGLIGEHLHLQNKFNSKRGCKVYVHRTAQANPNSKAACLLAEDSFTYRYKPEFYDCYKSAVAHNKKFRIPGKLVSVILTFIIALCMGAYFFKKANDEPIEVKTGKESTFTEQQKAMVEKYDSKKPAPVASASPVAPVQQPVSTVPPAPVPVDPELSRIAMVIQSSSKCRAFNSYGELLRIPESDCRDFSDNPVMLSSSRTRNTQPMPALQSLPPVQQPLEQPLQQVPQQPTVQTASYHPAI